MITKLLLLYTFFLRLLFYANATSNVFCYVDSKSFRRNGLGKMNINTIKPALSQCTHLIYGFAGIDPKTYELISLNPDVDIKLFYYTAVTHLKYLYPNVKILLSVGGNADENNGGNYFSFLEASDFKIKFANHSVKFLKKYGFDGIDLAWQFPTIAPKPGRKSFWTRAKEFFFRPKTFVDLKEVEHKNEFALLLAYASDIWHSNKLIVTVSILPNVNATAYFDTPIFAKYVNFLNIWAFDFYTPSRNPKEASNSAPLYEVAKARPFENADYIITKLLESGMHSNKIILIIPMFVRTWKVRAASKNNGNPPAKVSGPGDAGPFTAEAGLLSHTELCLEMRKNTTEKQLREFKDKTNAFETYGYREPDSKRNDGLWVSYESILNIRFKKIYVIKKSLGGVGVYDISLDDFQGACTSVMFPLLNKVTKGLPD